MAFRCPLTLENQVKGVFAFSLKTVIGCFQAGDSREISKSQQGPSSVLAAEFIPGMNSVISKHKDWVGQSLHFFLCPPYLPIIWQIFTELNFLKIKIILRTNRKKKEG